MTCSSCKEHSRAGDAHKDYYMALAAVAVQAIRKRNVRRSGSAAPHNN